MGTISETLRDYSRTYYKDGSVGIIDFDSQEEVLFRFFRRLEEGSLTREENPFSHFCVYFAAYNPNIREIFVGHHIKSELWLFNGGHIDKGESSKEAAVREMGEEWGNFNCNIPDLPNLLTITEINSQKVQCKLHWDIWYFISVDKDNFALDSDKLRTEFHENKWVSIDSAKNIITDLSTLKAIQVLSRKF